jgi:hypothetical protein
VAPSQQALLVEAQLELGGLAIESTVILPLKDGIIQMVVRNDSKRLDEGAVLGVIENAEVMEVSPDLGATYSAAVNRLDSSNCVPRKKLPDKMNLPTLPPDEFQQLKDFLADQHDVFSLEEGEGGETDIVQFEKNTGDAPPQKQPALCC